MFKSSDSTASTTLLNKLNEQLVFLKEFFKNSLPKSSQNWNNEITNQQIAAENSSNGQGLFFSESLPLNSNKFSMMSDLNKSLVNSTATNGPKEFIMNNRRQIALVLSKLLGLGLSAVVTYFLFKWLMKNLDPTNADKLGAKTRAEKIMKEIGLKNMDLNEYELCIASNIIMPRNIDCSWQDIGGLEHIINDLRETVIYPLKNFESSGLSSLSSTSTNTNKTTNNIISRRSRLIQPPKGVLLFGPPGNAKTMIAKALAKESGARFINLQVSTLFDKWFGESQKRTEAVFSLAMKVQPVIIFIDEIDSFLRSRRMEDHECTSTIKTQFMTLWDGLSTMQNQNRILIVGATNRPEDVDPAILRRMPQMFYIGLPNEVQRKKILNVILKDENLASDVNLDDIAERTIDFSGSDLHELCRCAAMNSFITTLKSINSKENQTVQPSTSAESVNVESASASPSDDSSQNQVALIRKIDFEVAFEKMSVKNLTNLRNRFDFQTKSFY